MKNIFKTKNKKKDLLRNHWKSSNIKLCPDNCAPNTIRLLSDIVVTSHGSVELNTLVLEYQLYVDSYYRGNGFVNEPKQLKNMVKC